MTTRRDPTTVRGSKAIGFARVHDARDVRGFEMCSRAAELQLKIRNSREDVKIYSRKGIFYSDISLVLSFL
jgi:hypothetical protein